jgi:hypothetical protein
MYDFPVTRRLYKQMKGSGSNGSLASTCTASRPPSYYPSCEDDDGSFDGGSFKPPFDAVSSSGTQTPIQFTPGTTMYEGSEADSTVGKSKKPRHRAPHCKSCTCLPPTAEDPNALKTARGRLYGRRQLVNASVSALATFNATGNLPAKAKQMAVMRQVLKQSELPYTDVLYQNSPIFEPWNENKLDSEIRALINPTTGFPETLQEAYKASCDAKSQRARPGLEGFHARLQMAMLESDDDDSD